MSTFIANKALDTFNVSIDLIELFHVCNKFGKNKNFLHETKFFSSENNFIKLS